jgi:hypothetical protein
VSLYLRKRKAGGGAAVLCFRVRPC